MENFVETKEDLEKSKQRITELWESKNFDKFEVGTFKGLQQIHHYIFQDVFPFAGEVRNVNISKGDFTFASLRFLNSNLKIIDAMPENSYDEIIEKYAEMNVAHPFREGNGRSTRIWLDLVLKKRLKICIDWSKIDKYNYLSAMSRSPINTLELRMLLKNAITSNIEDREIFMKGIQTSYAYEGYKIDI